MLALLHKDVVRKRAAGRRMIRGFAASWLPIWTWSLQGWLIALRVSLTGDSPDRAVVGRERSTFLGELLSAYDIPSET